MIPATVRVFVCTEPQDMRRGFDRLAQVVQQVMGGDPRSGDLFVFTSRGSDRLKMLWWDRNGYAVLYKRLHGATTRAPKIADPSLRVIGRVLPLYRVEAELGAVEFCGEEGRATLTSCEGPAGRGRSAPDGVRRRGRPGGDARGARRRPRGPRGRGRCRRRVRSA